MSIIISLFILAYLAAIVLASILSIVWIISLLFEFVPVMRKVFTERLHRHSSHGLRRSLSHYVLAITLYPIYCISTVRYIYGRVIPRLLLRISVANQVIMETYKITIVRLHKAGN